MTTPIRIALCGLPHSGKDTSADILVDKFGFVRVRFATPVKMATAEMFGWDANDEEDKDSPLIRNIAGDYLSKRDIWRDMAENYIKPRFGEDFFARRLAQEVAVHYPADNVVVTDLRFPIEAMALRRAGFTVVEVQREDQPHVQGLHDHRVENLDLSNYIDYQISAPSGLPLVELHNRLGTALQGILAKLNPVNKR